MVEIILGDTSITNTKFPTFTTRSPGPGGCVNEGRASCKIYWLHITITAVSLGRIQARELYPGAQLPATESLWAEGSHWAFDALTRTATTANSENKSPYEMVYGNPPPVVLGVY